MKIPVWWPAHVAVISILGLAAQFSASFPLIQGFVSAEDAQESKVPEQSLLADVAPTVVAPTPTAQAQRIDEFKKRQALEAQKRDTEELRKEQQRFDKKIDRIEQNLYKLLDLLEDEKPTQQSTQESTGN